MEIKHGGAAFHLRRCVPLSPLRWWVRRMMVAGYTGGGSGHWHWTDNEQIYLPALLYLIRHHGLGLTSGSQTQGHGDKRIFLDLEQFLQEKRKEFSRVFTRIYDQCQFTHWTETEEWTFEGGWKWFGNLHRGCAPDNEWALWHKELLQLLAHLVMK